MELRVKRIEMLTQPKDFHFFPLVMLSVFKIHGLPSYFLNFCHWGREVETMVATPQRNTTEHSYSL